ncbi:MAG: lysoplasmalogenase [Crocinitomicaceae bacterium]
MNSLIFVLIIVASGGLAIYFRHKKNEVGYAVMKPLTTILIICLAFLMNVGRDSEYGWTVIIGLIFSLIGDALLLKDRWFVQGLLAFLLAHIVFVYAFSSLFGFNTNLVLLAVLVLVGSIYFRFLLPHLKSYTIPVALYFLVILVMDWQAIGLSFSSDESIFYALGLSSILFSFSDGVLAYNKFVRELKFAGFLILTSYWVAIFIISVSIAFV